MLGSLPVMGIPSILPSLYRCLSLPFPRRDDFAGNPDDELLYDEQCADIDALHRAEESTLTADDLDNLPVQNIWEMIDDREARRRAYERDVKTLVAYAKTFSDNSDEAIAHETSLTRSTVNRYRNDLDAQARAFKLAQDAVWTQRHHLSPDVLTIVTALRSAQMPEEDRARSMLAAAGITHPIGAPQ